MPHGIFWQKTLFLAAAFWSAPVLWSFRMSFGPRKRRRSGALQDADASFDSFVDILPPRW